MSTVKGASLLILLSFLFANPTPLLAQAFLSQELEDEERELARQKDKADSKNKDEKKSSDGEYEWKMSYGAGLETGLFFTQLNRWNTKFLEPSMAPTFDTDVTYNLDLALEISPLESTRFTLFGGFQGPMTSNPSLSAMYFGIEPAFAFRRELWEMALGLGVGFGRAEMTLDDGNSAAAGLVTMRPFLEVRRYFSSLFALYGRMGFNYWVTHSVEPLGVRVSQGSDQGSSTNLNEGGLYLALGIRFGSYPEHTKKVGDLDGDGIKDDVDDCPQEKEDEDGFEDKDGCADLDNDKDGIEDSKDKCPDEAEDQDGWMDEDGCPEEDDDLDNDKILNKDDTCPNKAEDYDGFKDKDGCPDDDNDNDKFLDKDDTCPNKAEDYDGFEDNDGCPEADNDRDGIDDDKDACPLQPGVVQPDPKRNGCPKKAKVRITKKKIEFDGKIFFATGKANIRPKSFALLNELSDILKQYKQITKIRIEGHTDDVGKDKKNLDLSGARAQAVLEYLTSQGVNASVLTFEGFGETAPLCNDVPKKNLGKRSRNKTVNACRAENRRVEFKILEFNGRPISDSSVTIEEREEVKEETPKNAAKPKQPAEPKNAAEPKSAAEPKKDAKP